MIYIDTGPLLARHLAHDQYHEEAVADWKRLASSPQRLFTSNFVLNEMVNMLAWRAGYRFAVERARNLFDSPRLTILRPNEHEEAKALTLMQRYADQKVSFTDCISFVLMRKHRIRRVLTFDRHFQLAGFEVWR